MGQGGVKVHTGTTVSFVPVVCMLNTAAQTWDRQMQHVQKGKRLFFYKLTTEIKEIWLASKISAQIWAGCTSRAFFFISTKRLETSHIKYNKYA